MKRENLNIQLEAIKLKINELTKNKFRYFIHGKYIPGFGPLQLITETTELVKAFSFIKSQFSEDKDLVSIENELGIAKLAKSEDSDEQTYLGFTLREWTEECQMKAAELNNQAAIDQLKSALKTFKGYRTEDEKFESDAKKFGALFDELGLSNASVPNPSERGGE